MIESNIIHEQLVLGLKFRLDYGLDWCNLWVRLVLRTMLCFRQGSIDLANLY